MFRSFLSLAVWLWVCCFTAAFAQAPPESVEPPPAESAEAPRGEEGRAADAHPSGGFDFVERLAREAQKSVVVVTVAGRDGKQHGLGSGFVVSADGLIATNLHVIGEARPISVQFADGKTFDVVAVHASDRPLDLAVVRIEAKDLPALPLGNSDQLEQGQPVVALGNPRGLRHSVVSGVVSGKREVEQREMIQLAIPIEPGNSGGPVLDREGRVHGIVTMKSALTENLGFAVPANALQPLLKKPNPVPMSRWLTIGALDPKEWSQRLGSGWQQRAGRILVEQAGGGFGGRSLCLSEAPTPEPPYEVGVWVQLDDEAGAAGLVFQSDGQHKHYGFYPSAGKLRLTRFEGSDVYSWTVMRNEASEHYRPGEWNHLKVRIEDEKFSCYVNDQLLFESRDDRLAPGKAGLAKFRNTRAEFKQFRMAEKIPASQLAPGVIEQFAAAIERLPALDTLLPEQLEPLAEESAGSVAVLREQAKQLEQRAEELRRIAADVHTQAVVAELQAVVDAEMEDDFDLPRAALLVARLDNDEVDVDAYLKQLDRMADQAGEPLADEADEAARLGALDKYLFAESGYHGSRTDYYHRANSYLDRVIDDREGLPITLSLLYMELGRRLGLTIEGVGLPGHFVVRHVPAEGEPQLIDVFEGGERMSREDAVKKVVALSGGPLVDEHLQAVSKKSIVRRMLGNLLGIAQRSDDREAMLRYLEAIVAIDPDAVADRGMRAVVRFETGRRSAAVADLDWFLENEPPGLEIEKIRQMRDYFQSGQR